MLILINQPTINRPPSNKGSKICSQYCWKASPASALGVSFTKGLWRPLRTPPGVSEAWTRAMRCPDCALSLLRRAVQNTTSHTQGSPDNKGSLRPGPLTSTPRCPSRSGSWKQHSPSSAQLLRAQDRMARTLGPLTHSTRRRQWLLLPSAPCQMPWCWRGHPSRWALATQGAPCDWVSEPLRESLSLLSIIHDATQ